MEYNPMRINDLTKTDATTVVSYRDNIAINEADVRNSYPTHLVTECQLIKSNVAAELILNKIFNKKG
ncbi:MAG: hypothetical protein ACI9ES_002299 [Oceanospirillaceae bacterium]|jgi:hypothetical protein